MIVSKKSNVNKWPDGYGPVLFVKKLKEVLSDAQIAAVLQAIDSTCNYCWNSGKNCYCMRDD
jgi:hypothetical protein